VNDPDRNADAIELQAANWVMHSQQRRLSPRQARAFARWRQADPRHAEAARRAERAWRAAEILRSDPALAIPERVAPRIGPVALPAWLAPAGWRPARAVALAALLLVSWLVLHDSRWLLPLHSDHHTVTGEVRNLLLEDGTGIQLGSRSALNIRYTASERRVQLLSGEAIFTPAPRDGSEPRAFVVEVAGATATALGTRYLVRAEDDHRGLVAVLEHSVDVRLHQRPAAGRDHHQVRSGETVVFDTRQGIAVADIDPEHEASWSQGMLVFRRAPLDRIIQRLADYRGGRILVARQELKSQPVSAVFQLRNLDNAAQILSRELDARIVELPGLTVLY